MSEQNYLKSFSLAWYAPKVIYTREPLTLNLLFAVSNHLSKPYYGLCSSIYLSVLEKVKIMECVA